MNPQFQELVGKMLAELCAWFNCFINHIPGRIGLVIRRVWYRRKLRAGEKLHVGFGSKFINTRGIIFGNNVSLGDGCTLNAEFGRISCADDSAFNERVIMNASLGGSISIGKNCLIGPGVMVFTANHEYSNPEMAIRHQGHNVKDVVIGNDCWLGAMVIILPGVKLGDGAIIGAGSVVTRDIPPASVAAGIPAVVIRQRG